MTTTGNTGLPPIDGTPTEYEIKLATGQVYKGATQDEAMAKLVAAQEEATRTISSLRTPAPVVETPKPVAGQFDVNEYYRRFAADPNTALTYQLAELFGMPEAEVVPAMKYAHEIAVKADLQMNIAAFHAAHPEYPGGDAAAALLTADLGDAQWTAQNIEASYFRLREAGKITPLTTTPATAVPLRTAAPTLGGGSPTTGPDVTTQFGNLSTADQEAYLRKIGML